MLALSFRLPRFACVLLLSPAWLAAPAVGAEESQGDATPSVELEPERFVVTTTVDGVFESTRRAEVIVAPQEWSQLEVKEVVDAGQRVAEGEVILRLDTEDIDRAIGDLETAIESAELALKQAELELEILEKTTPLDLEAAMLAAREADRELLHFLKEGRELQLKSAEQSLKSSRNYLEYQLEELRQLEKMYKADDLTEETEEIILKRQRDTVEQLRHSLERAESSHKETVEVEIPRRERGLEDTARREELDRKRAEVSLPLKLDSARRSLQKQEVELGRSREKLEELREDRESLTVRAPMGGVVYYGRADRGRWTTASSLQSKLKPGETVQKRQVLMTIVDPRELAIRATVPEDKLHLVREGREGFATPTAFPSRALEVEVEDVGRFPLASGGFDASFAIRTEETGRLVPGMTCKVRVVAHMAEEALLVPKDAVFQDEVDPSRHHVYLRGEDVEPRKQPVEVGLADEKHVQVLSGVKAGQPVLLKKPE